MSAVYRVELRLGAYRFTIRAGQPQPGAEAAPVVLDGLRLGWQYAGDSWPAQLEPMTATVQLLVRDAAQLAGLGIDQLASVRVLDDTTGASCGAVYGRIAEATADPAPRLVDGAREVWTRYTVQLTDHLATTNPPITLNQPTEGTWERWQALRTAADPASYAGAPEGLLGALGRTEAQVYFAAEQLAEAGLLDAARTYLAQLPLGVEASAAGNYAGTHDLTGWVGAFPLLLPYTDADTGQLLRLVPAWVPRPHAAELPAQLQLVDTTLQLRPAPGGSGLAAADVELSGSWKLTRARGTTAVTVTHPTDPPVTVTAPEYRKDRTLRRTVESTLTPAAARQRLASAYLAELLPAGWDREAFTWHPTDLAQLAGGRFVPDLAGRLDATDPGTIVPAAGASSARVDWAFGLMAPEAFTAPVAVFDVAPQHRLDRATRVYSGRLAGAELTVEGGRVTVGLAVWREAPPRPADDRHASWGAGAWNGPRLTWAHLRTLPTVRLRVPAGSTSRRVDPALTYRDVRLARASS